MVLSFNHSAGVLKCQKPQRHQAIITLTVRGNIFNFCSSTWQCAKKWLNLGMCTEVKVLWMYIRHLIAEVAKFCTVIPPFTHIHTHTHTRARMCAYQFIVTEQEKPDNSKAHISFQNCGWLEWNLSLVTFVEPRIQRQLIRS